jgi:LacI family transcriptional regulator
MDGHEPERTTSMREVAEHAGVAMSSVSRVLSGHPDVSPAMRRRVIAAVERLVLLGHARIGLVGGPDNLRPGRECARAVVDACAERGARAIVEAGPFSPEHGYAATSHMLDAAEAPTALIAGSNQIFPGVLRALRERDLAIPEDVSLVTFDDVLLLDFLEPGIAVVSREPLRIGQEAARLLLRLLAGGGPEQVVVPTVFDPRASLAAPAARR